MKVQKLVSVFTHVHVKQKHEASFLKMSLCLNFTPTFAPAFSSVSASNLQRRMCKLHAGENTFASDCSCYSFTIETYCTNDSLIFFLSPLDLRRLSKPMIKSQNGHDY